MVEQNQPGLFVGGDPGGVDSVFSGEDGEVPLLEEAGKNLAVDPVVVNDQNLL